MFREYEVVKLKRDISPNLTSGTLGTVLIVYDELFLPLAYEVEFIDHNGKTLAVITVKDVDLEKVNSSSEKNIAM